MEWVRGKMQGMFPHISSAFVYILYAARNANDDDEILPNWSEVKMLSDVCNQRPWKITNQKINKSKRKEMHYVFGDAIIYPHTMTLLCIVCPQTRTDKEAYRRSLLEASAVNGDAI